MKVPFFLRWIVAPMVIAAAGLELVRRSTSERVFLRVACFWVGTCWAANIVMQIDTWRMKRRMHRQTLELAEQIKREMPDVMRSAVSIAFDAKQAREELEALRRGEPPRPPVVH